MRNDLRSRVRTTHTARISRFINEERLKLLRRITNWKFPHTGYDPIKAFQLTTGCPKVRGYFDTPLFSGMGEQIRLIFHMLNKWCLRFCLMYKTLKYNPPTLRKFKRKVGQVTEKFGKKPHLQRVRMQTGHRIKDLSLLLIIFGLFCFHIGTKCH